LEDLIVCLFLFEEVHIHAICDNAFLIGNLKAKHVIAVGLSFREHFDLCMGPVLETLKDRENKPEYTYYGQGRPNGQLMNNGRGPLWKRNAGLRAQPRQLPGEDRAAGQHCVPRFDCDIGPRWIDKVISKQAI
jgi:hypothetical protein